MTAKEIHRQDIQQAQELQLKGMVTASAYLLSIARAYAVKYTLIHPDIYSIAGFTTQQGRGCSMITMLLAWLAYITSMRD